MAGEGFRVLRGLGEASALARELPGFWLVFVSLLHFDPAGSLRMLDQPAGRYVDTVVQ